MQDFVSFPSHLRNLTGVSVSDASVLPSFFRCPSLSLIASCSISALPLDYRGASAPCSRPRRPRSSRIVPSPLGVSYCISWLRAPTPLSPESLLVPRSFSRPHPSRAAALCHRLLLRVSDLVLRVYLLLPPLLRRPSDTTLFCVFLFDLASTY